MATQPIWSIGKDAGPQGNIADPPFRAYFYWVGTDGLTRAADYSIAELKGEIERLRAIGTGTEAFEAALKSLSIPNEKH